jgi:hypothetical protein
MPSQWAVSLTAKASGVMDDRRCHHTWTDRLTHGPWYDRYPFLVTHQIALNEAPPVVFGP